MDDFLSKPFDQQELYRVLGRWLPTHTAIVDSSASENTVNNDSPATSIDLTYIRSMCDGDDALLTELLYQYSIELPKRLAALQLAVTQNDIAKINLHAHTLKGNAGNLGATQLHNAAEQLESISKHATEITEPLQQIIARVEQATNRVYLELLHSSGTTNTQTSQ